MGRELTAPNSQELHYASWLPILHVWFPSRKKFVRQNSRSASRHSKAYNNATKENDHRQGTPGEAQGLIQGRDQRQRPPRKHKLKKKKSPTEMFTPGNCSNAQTVTIQKSRAKSSLKLKSPETVLELNCRCVRLATKQQQTVQRDRGSARLPVRPLKNADTGNNRLLLVSLLLLRLDNLPRHPHWRRTCGFQTNECAGTWH